MKNHETEIKLEEYLLKFICCVINFILPCKILLLSIYQATQHLQRTRVDMEQFNL